MDDRLLKRAFLIDGLVGAVFAAVLLGGADLLAGPLGLSAGFLTFVGWLALPFDALFLAIAWTGSPSLARIGVAANIAWVVGSAAVISVLQPTLLGVAFVAVQAVVVAELAWFEWKGLRRVVPTSPEGRGRVSR